jgi:heterodisulfide reductase subunit A
VAYAEDNLYTCSQDTQAHIRDMIEEHELNRVIVASCTPRTHEPLFQETIREAGLNRHLFEMANIRDQCSWIHMGLSAEATEKAKDLLRMAVAKVRLVEPLPTIPLDVKQSALVLGGGPAGMSAALSLAAQGFPVHIVERQERLGGNLNKVLSTVEGRDTSVLLEQLHSKIDKNEKITVHLNSTIQQVEGFVGQFKTRLTGNGSEAQEIEHGVTIIATGAQESKPTEYLYGEDRRVLTGQEFEELVHAPEAEKLPKRVVFIQCVGSREEGHMYCSRVCCRESVKNALALKKKRPEAEVYILFRDIRTYGFSERYYREARDSGVIFLRYEPEAKPTVENKDGALLVSVKDIQSGETIRIDDPDVVVLAARIDAEKGNEVISQIFKVPLNQDGYFLEAHVKLRPVDFATEGVYVAGMAHNPKTIEESIVQGRAAAARAATIIAKDKYLAEATIAAVNEDLCDGCGICVGVCEYSALEIQEKPDGTKVVKLNEAACKGCGCCVAACPSGAMEQKGYKNDQIMAEIDAALL